MSTVVANSPYQFDNSNNPKSQLDFYGVIFASVVLFALLFFWYFPTEFALFVLNHFLHYHITGKDINAFASKNSLTGSYLYGSLYGLHGGGILWIFTLSGKKFITKAFLSNFQEYVIIGSIISVVLFVYPFYVLMKKIKALRYLVANPITHGSASFADNNDLAGYGFNDKDGAVIGGISQDTGFFFKKKKVKKLLHNGPEHIFVFAPTRSGKGVSLVIPTLLTWAASLICYDIKGENYNLTSGYRRSKLKNKILKFEPSSRDSIKFNPLNEIGWGTDSEVSDVQNIANIIVSDPEGGGGGNNEHWLSTARSLLVGVIIHVHYDNELPEKSLRVVRRFITSQSTKEMCDKMMNTMHDPNMLRGWVDNTGQPTATHPVVTSSAGEMASKPDEEGGSVKSTALRFLTLYEDDIVGTNTSMSDFCVTDLTLSDKPVTLYLVVSVKDQARMAPLIKLIWELVIKKLTSKMDFKDGSFVKPYKHRLLLLIDEFPTLGKMDIMETALAMMAGYGLKAYLIAQDITQVKRFYTDKNSIISNCHIRIAYAPNEFETADILSKTLGNKTVRSENISTTQQSGGGSSSTSTAKSYQEHQRPLMSPDEIMQLPGAIKDPKDETKVVQPGAMLIMVAGRKAILGTQPMYFFDDELKDRVKISPTYDRAFMKLRINIDNLPKLVIKDKDGNNVYNPVYKDDYKKVFNGPPHCDICDTDDIEEHYNTCLYLDKDEKVKVVKMCDKCYMVWSGIILDNKYLINKNIKKKTIIQHWSDVNNVDISRWNNYLSILVKENVIKQELADNVKI